MPKLNNHARRLMFNFLGLSISVIPVSVSILSYFPLWLRRGDASILSGISLILLGLALIPMYKRVKEVLRSASAPLMWFIIFVIFFLLAKISDEITVISFVGFVTNVVGAIFFRAAKQYDRMDNNAK